MRLTVDSDVTYTPFNTYYYYTDFSPWTYPERIGLYQSRLYYDNNHFLVSRLRLLSRH